MIKVIVLDLDDTLLDTSGLLIPGACLKIYNHLKSMGFSNSFESFETSRKSFVKQSSHKEFFKKFVAENTQALRLNSNTADELLKQITNYFYDPEIPENIHLLEGATENLNYFQKKYKLALVTSGIEKTQKLKVAKLNLNSFIPIENQFYISGEMLKTKKQAFQILIEKEKIKATELLSIGNRLSQEIRMCKELGGHTCYFQYGEHAEDTPKDQFEIPDFTVKTHHEIIATCRL